MLLVNFRLYLRLVSFFQLHYFLGVIEILVHLRELCVGGLRSTWSCHRSILLHTLNAFATTPVLITAIITLIITTAIATGTNVDTLVLVLTKVL